jgi:hypothetical protein
MGAWRIIWVFANKAVELVQNAAVSNIGDTGVLPVVCLWA